MIEKPFEIRRASGAPHNAGMQTYTHHFGAFFSFASQEFEGVDQIVRKASGVVAIRTDIAAIVVVKCIGDH